MNYEPIFQILRRMITCYILEISNMDVEISKFMNWKPILKPFPQPEGLESLNVGYIQKEPWGSVYKKLENGVKQICMMLLRNKHLHLTNSLNNVLSRDEVFKVWLFLATWVLLRTMGSWRQ